MVTEVNAVTFRQNLGEMLNQVQYRNDSIVISKDGKPVAALVDAELFARIRRMRDRFDALSNRIAEAYASVPEDKGMAEIDAVCGQGAARLMAGLRVVLDTNVLVSGLAYPNSIPGRILNAWQHGAIGVVLSRYILDEVARVLPKLKRIALTRAEIRDLADSLMLMAETVEPDAKLERALRDKTDQAVLATLRASHADYLVTGDKDLLALAERYPIVTPVVFWQRHGG